MPTEIFGNTPNCRSSCAVSVQPLCPFSPRPPRLRVSPFLVRAFEILSNVPTRLAFSSQPRIPPPVTLHQSQETAVPWADAQPWHSFFFRGRAGQRDGSPPTATETQFRHSTLLSSHQSDSPPGIVPGHPRRRRCSPLVLSSHSALFPVLIVSLKKRAGRQPSGQSRRPMVARGGEDAADSFALSQTCRTVIGGSTVVQAYETIRPITRPHCVTGRKLAITPL